MSSVEYILHAIYCERSKYAAGRTAFPMIEIRVNELLAEQGRSFYWLAKETGISHTTLWRLKKGKAFGINFDTLEKMCRTLDCQPGDILTSNGKKRSQGRVKQSAKHKQK
jgi:putative transcriptional regulator